MELRRYFAILRSRALIILATVVVGLAAAYLTTDTTSRYTATATIYVGNRNIQVTERDPDVSNDVLIGFQRISATFARMLDSYSVAADAAQRARVNRSATTVQSELEATPQVGTQLLDVTITDVDPAVAQSLANAVVDSFIEKVQTVEPGTVPQPGQPPTLPAYVYEHARLPVDPEPTDMVRRLLLGGGFGLVAAVGLAFLLEYLDVTIRTPDDAERKLELPVLGVIPFDSKTEELPRQAVGIA